MKLERDDPAVGSFNGQEGWNTNPPPSLPITSLAPLPTAREGLAVAVLSDQLYALGGHTSGGGATAAVESYNPVTDSWWTSRAPLPLARTWPPVAVMDSTLYAVGAGEQSAPVNRRGVFRRRELMDDPDGVTDANRAHRTGCCGGRWKAVCDWRVRRHHQRGQG